ncbi:hypothetical protein [Streptomyces sp. NPDC048295]|uniref:hypothetical protein n=1 Tax=Streptomyces sp. NPDC048295 TaxID=3154617 RepID=UPI00343EFC55
MYGDGERGGARDEGGGQPGAVAGEAARTAGIDARHGIAAVADSAGKGKAADEPSPAGSHRASAEPGSGSKAAAGRTAAGGGTAAGSTVKSTAAQQFSAYAGPHRSGSGVSYSEHGSSIGRQQRRPVDDRYSPHGSNGRFRSIPMSGDGSDAGTYATWSFSTGSVTSGSCRISVHIPDSSDIRHAGGAPSYCTVHAGSSSSRTQPASFTIDQAAHHGQWVAAPNVRIGGGKPAVVLHDRGKDGNSEGSTDAAHHAADVVYANCS